MQSFIKKGIAVVLSAGLLSAVAATSVAAETALQLDLSDSVSFYGARTVMEQYVTRDGGAVKLLNQKQLYRWNLSNGSYTEEYRFPEQGGFSPNAGAGSFHVVGNVQSAYINENTGMLYYAYDKYKYVNSTDDMTIGVIAYDLERSAASASFEVDGENVSAVGADDSGNIYLAVRQQFEDVGSHTAILVLDSQGNKLTQTTVTSPVDTFLGFAENGKFYCAETAYTPTGGGYYYISRRLKSGVYSGGTLTLNSTQLAPLEKNYIRPAAMTGGYLATCATAVYDPANDAPVAAFSGCQRTGSGFTRNFCGANAVIADGTAYVLATAHTVRAFDLNSGELTGYYSTDKTIVSLIEGKNGLVLLTRADTGCRYEVLPFDGFEAVGEQLIDLNTLPAFQRTQSEIVRRFSEAVPQDYNAPMFSETGSVTAPYKEYTISEGTQESLVRTASYYRWLAGLKGFETADAATWSNAAKGAVLTERNFVLTHSLSHTPEKPADMDDDFYQAGYTATSTSNISYGYGNGQYAIVNLLRGFLNDRGYLIPGHRDTFMTRNGVSFAAGYSEQGGVNTIIYQGNPNPQGASVTGNDLPAYAWPAPGCFPAEDIDTSAVWTINLNTDLAGTTDKEVCVTITDLQTGEQFVRDSEETGLYSTTSWGKYLSFLPPTATSYAGKRYRVEVTNLINAEMLPVKLSYTVSFFSYADGAELDGVICTADKYGRLTAVCDLGDVNGDGMVTVIDVTEIQRIVAELHVPDDRERLAADVDRNGIVSIADATRLQNYLAEYFDKL